MNWKIHVFVVSKLNTKTFHLRMMKQNAPIPTEKKKKHKSVFKTEHWNRFRTNYYYLPPNGA